MKERWRKASTGTPSDDFLSSRISTRRRDREHHRNVEKALRDSGGSAPTAAGAKGATAGGDTKKLRGIPALAPGVGGTQDGTQPLRETIRRDEQRQRRRERLGDA